MTKLILVIVPNMSYGKKTKVKIKNEVKFAKSKVEAILKNLLNETTLCN